MGGSSLSTNVSLGKITELGAASDRRLDLGTTNPLNIEPDDPLESEFRRRLSTALRVVQGFDVAVALACVELAEELAFFDVNGLGPKILDDDADEVVPPPVARALNFSELARTVPGVGLPSDRSVLEGLVKADPDKMDEVLVEDLLLPGIKKLGVGRLTGVGGRGGVTLFRRNSLGSGKGILSSSLSDDRESDDKVEVVVSGSNCVETKPLEEEEKPVKGKTGVCDLEEGCDGGLLSPDFGGSRGGGSGAQSSSCSSSFRVSISVFGGTTIVYFGIGTMGTIRGEIVLDCV